MCIRDSSRAGRFQDSDGKVSAPLLQRNDPQRHDGPGRNGTAGKNTYLQRPRAFHKRLQVLLRTSDGTQGRQPVSYTHLDQQGPADVITAFFME